MTTKDSEKINIFWFRRDLRLDDNAGLWHALTSGKPVLPIFIFDTNILNKLTDKHDRRLSFIHKTILSIQEKLKQFGAAMQVLHETPENAFKQLLNQYDISMVYTNHDYEPYAIERDECIKNLLRDHSISLHTYKDHVIFEKDEIIKDDGKPYTVFTPYSRKWKATLQAKQLEPFACGKLSGNFLQQPATAIPSLKQLGFLETTDPLPENIIHDELILNYANDRDFPGINGTTRLGVHLRFGTISIRKLATVAQKLSGSFLNELIWRDFYQMILWQFPYVGKGKSFKPAYDSIVWRNDSGEFEKWCEGMTGYPIVDAGMRELKATGFMHNRVRMIVASFLCKHLLLDWRLGEAWFAEKLLDFEFASNNGGWQWASGSGCDAAPYFRIFNPYLQTKKFDPHFTYIKKWVPEFQEFSYPKPLVDHEFARKRCMEVYGKALRKSDT